MEQLNRTIPAEEAGRTVRSIMTAPNRKKVPRTVQSAGDFFKLKNDLQFRPVTG